MNKSTYQLILALLLLTIIIFPMVADAQVGFQFGQNKVQYKNFKWSELRTKHFDIYYYPEEEVAAKDAARMSERGYNYLSQVFRYQFKERIPLILYASLNDFQQTNVVQGMLGDGTRGVTESLKQRIVLPITGSYRSFNHVLVHEMVHAFQYDIWFKANDSGGSGQFNPPLWFMEGMAEYLSNGMDNVTRMWVRDGILHDNLLTIDELNKTMDIRVYRIGQALFYYIGERYGKEKIGDILKSAIRMGDVQAAFVKNIGKDFKTLTPEWHAALKKQVLPDSTLSLKQPDQIAQQITEKESFFNMMNVTPSVSPDGSKIAYVSNKNLNEEIELLELKDDGTYSSRTLIKGGQSKMFESLHVLDTSIGWSHDGKKIAFISKSGQNDGIFVFDVESEQILHELTFKNLNGLFSPSFSPDDQKLVFVGMSGGQSNLYTFDIQSGQLTALTNDRYSVLHPQWSPDGTRIIFATDRGPDTDIDQLLFSDYDLALYYLNNGKIEMITHLKGDATNPQWSSDGSEITFVSDHQGIPNIYWYDLKSGMMLPVTTLENGVSGITETTPCFSWSANGQVMVFSTFENEGWQIYKLTTPKTETRFVVNANMDEPVMQETPQPIAEADSSMNMANDSSKTEGSNWLPELQEPNMLYKKYELAHKDSIEERNYNGGLKLDGIFTGGNFGGYYGSVGGAQFLFSDMLGNKNLIISAGLRFDDILRSDLGAAYFNQGHRLNYGFQAFQLSDLYVAFATYNQLGLIEQTYRGVSAFSLYPFSRYSRIELSAAAVSVGQDILVDTYIMGNRTRERTKLGTLMFGQFSGSLVFDNTVFGSIGPLTGSRSRFTVQQAVNDLVFTSVFGDYRRYFNIYNRSALAYRLIGATSFGRDFQFFQIGGPYTFRGADYGDLVGPNILIQNLEYRFPLFPFLSYQYDFLSGVAFFDAAAAWGTNVPGYVKETFQPFSTAGGFHFKDLSGAYGIGFRFRFGYLGLRLDLAWPTNLQATGKMKTLFSIGTDF